MKLSYAIAFSLLLVGVSVGAWVIAAPTFTPQPGVLVLKNGRVLEGELLREGDRWLIISDKGDSQIRVPVADVDFTCRDLGEAYEIKRASLRGGDIKQHLDLAEWCLRHRMFDRATDEVLAASAIDPRDRRLAAVERKLELAAAAPSSKPRPTVRLPLSQEEIAREIKAVPRDAQEQFVTTIEPLLLNRCSAAGCHGPGTTSSYHLVRPPLTHHNTLRETQRNLYATMQQLKLQGESPLLAVPQRPHGNAREAVFGEHEARHLRELAAWIELARRPAEAANVESRPREHLVRPAQHEEPVQASDRDWPYNLGGRGAGPQRAGGPPRQGGAAPGRGSRPGNAPADNDAPDEFAPDIFNQQFRGRGQAPAPAPRGPGSR